MYCKKCGTKMENDLGFCENCGAEQPQGAEQSRPQAEAVTTPIDIPASTSTKSKTNALIVSFAAGVLVAGLIIFGLFSAGIISIGNSDSKRAIGSSESKRATENSESKKLEGMGFDSPEEAAEAYLTALKNADMDAMISAFAVESLVENVDFKAFITRSGGYSINSNPPLPSNNQLTIGMNIYNRYGYIANTIRYQYMNLFMSDLPATSYQPMGVREDAAIDDLVNTLGNPSYLDSLNTLRIVEFVSPESLGIERYYSEAALRNIRSIMDIYGIQELKDVAARVEIDGKTYIFCFDVALCNGKWYIRSLGGMIGQFLDMDPSAGFILE